MYLLGAALTKVLATLAAVMTVTAGMPSFQCRCPDGRVKLFCQGNDSSARAACAASESSSLEIKSCCCQAKQSSAKKTLATKKHACCTNSDSAPHQEAGSDGSQIVVKAPCCVKTIVADASVYSVADSGPSVHNLVAALVQPELAPILMPAASRTASTRSPPGFLAPPTDLVIIFCHFTC